MNQLFKDKYVKMPLLKKEPVEMIESIGNFYMTVCKFTCSILFIKYSYFDIYIFINITYGYSILKLPYFILN